MGSKNVKIKKTDEGKKSAKFKKGSRYSCNVCGMEISVYGSCECVDTNDSEYVDKKIIVS